jgi:hypothetical protein
MSFVDPVSAGAPRAPSSARDNSPLLELKQASRRFPGVAPRDRVDFESPHGEADVLFGENVPARRR